MILPVKMSVFCLAVPCLSTTLHGVSIQKTWTLIFSTVRTPNIIQWRAIEAWVPNGCPLGPICFATSHTFRPHQQAFVPSVSYVPSWFLLMLWKFIQPLSWNRGQFTRFLSADLSYTTSESESGELYQSLMREVQTVSSTFNTSSISSRVFARRKYSWIFLFVFFFFFKMWIEKMGDCANYNFCFLFKTVTNQAFMLTYTMTNLYQ
jgi:hypothetical protein